MEKRRGRSYSFEGAQCLIGSFHTGSRVNCTVNPAGVSVEKLGNDLPHEFPTRIQLELNGGRRL